MYVCNGQISRLVIGQSVSYCWSPIGQNKLTLQTSAEARVAPGSPVQVCTETAEQVTCTAQLVQA